MTDYEPTPPPSTPSTPYGATPYDSAAVAPKSPVLSILSLVFGILGVLGALFLFGVGFLPAVAAIVLGFLGRRKEPAAKGMWLTGIILGFVGVVVSIIVWALFAIAVAIASQNGYQTTP